MMYAKIDWYGTMITLDPPDTDGGGGGLEWILSQLMSKTNLGYAFGFDPKAWSTLPGRGVFSDMFVDSTHGLFVHKKRNSNDVKVEITGVGCTIFEEYAGLQQFIYTTKGRCSRIDCAIDIECDNPQDAQAKCLAISHATVDAHPRASLSEHHTPSGDTFYLGSWNSERFARCYHYNEPHPRAKLVRLETCYKGKWAKKLLGEVELFPLEYFVKVAHLPYKWEGVDLEELSVGGIEVFLPRSDKSGGSHTRWLLTVCVPAIEKALRKGEISLAYLLEKLLPAEDV